MGLLKTPMARIAAALEGQVRFSLDTGPEHRPAGSPRRYRYRSPDLPSGARVLLEVSRAGKSDGSLVLMSGYWTIAAKAQFTGELVEFWPNGLEESPEDTESTVGLVMRLALAAQKAAGKDFHFEASTGLGLRTVTLDMHKAARQAMDNRKPKFKLAPKPGETRDPERIDRVLAKLGEMWKAQPDMRLGQMVSVLAAKSGTYGGDVFLVEDEEIETVLDQMGTWFPAEVSPR